MTIRATALSVACCFLLVSCSETAVKPEPKSTEKTAAPEAITGRHAFQQMYPMARAWAIDAMPVRLQSINLTQLKSSDGKAGAWEALFFSPTSGKTKLYTWSAVESAGNLHEGVFAGQEESMGSLKPFPVAAIQKDSDEVYKVAVAASREYIRKNPTKPVIYVLEMSNRFSQLAWQVVWGESLGTSDYSVFVDSATGKLLAKI